MINDSKIKQSASQMMSLCRKFGLIIGDKTPENEPHWHIFLILLRICSIACAPSCTHDLVPYLRICVEEYLLMFHQLYPVIPKQHYMLHYAPQIERFGPLIHSWTMRQESKLSFVKECHALVKCCKNGGTKAPVLALSSNAIKSTRAYSST